MNLAEKKRVTFFISPNEQEILCPYVAAARKKLQVIASLLTKSCVYYSVHVCNTAYTLSTTVRVVNWFVESMDLYPEC